MSGARGFWTLNSVFRAFSIFANFLFRPICASKSTFGLLCGRACSLSGRPSTTHQSKYEQLYRGRTKSHTCLRKCALLPPPPPPLLSPSSCSPPPPPTGGGGGEAPQENSRYAEHCRYGRSVMTKPCLRTPLCRRSLQPVMALRVVLLPLPSLSLLPLIDIMKRRESRVILSFLDTFRDPKGGRGGELSRVINQHTTSVKWK